ELWGEAPASVAIYNLDGNTEVISTRDADDLREVEEKVIAVSAGIKDAAASGEFHAQEGFHCNWCDFRALCPAKEENLYSIAAVAQRKS
ncbi:MAG: PD-(D/E)XK nuclease family protein, partial [Terriglobales bacterium]